MEVKLLIKTPPQQNKYLEYMISNLKVTIPLETLEWN